jgi:hypothetical protein
MKKDEKILEYIQEFYIDVGIPLNRKLEQAVYQSLRKALRGMRVEGSKEDIRTFKRALPRFATHHNVTIVEN